MAEPHNTGTEHVPKGEHKGAFPPFQSQTFASQLVWLVVAFVLLYVLMLKVALPRVGAIIEQRHKRIADDIADAGKLKALSDGVDGVGFALQNQRGGLGVLQMYKRGAI